MPAPTGGEEVLEGGVWLQETEAQQVRHQQVDGGHGDPHICEGKL